MDQHPCYICDKLVVVEGEGPRDIFCRTCRGKASDPEFVRGVLVCTPCGKPHSQNEQRQGGVLRRRGGNGQYACSICDFSVHRTSAAVLALITEQVSRGYSSASNARLERYHRWRAFNATMLSEEDRRVLIPPGVPAPTPPTAQPIGRTRGDQAEYDLRRGDEARLGPSPAPRKK